jgi:hypothetical protein
VTEYLYRISYKVAVCLRVTTGIRTEHADCFLDSDSFCAKSLKPFLIASYPEALNKTLNFTLLKRQSKSIKGTRYT